MLLTPEVSVGAQKSLGADIILPLDELPPYHIAEGDLAASVARSHRWMARRWVMGGLAQVGVSVVLRHSWSLPVLPGIKSRTVHSSSPLIWMGE